MFVGASPEIRHSQKKEKGGVNTGSMIEAKQASHYWNLLPILIYPPISGNFVTILRAPVLQLKHLKYTLLILFTISFFACNVHLVKQRITINNNNKPEK